MGIFSKKRTLTDDKQEGQDGNEEVKKKGGFLAGLFGSDKYRKAPEQAGEDSERENDFVYLKSLQLKKYNKQMSYRFNDNKNRIEVGQDFTMDQLPEIIYALANKSTVFRKFIGGRFDLTDRDRLKRIISKKRNRVRRLERKLNEGNERRQKISLGDLF